MRLASRGGGSSKFWEPKLSGRTLTVRFGRIGTDGQVRDTAFATRAAAQAALAKLIAEKTGKGYRPADRGPAPTAPKPSAKVTRRRSALLSLAKALGGAKGARIGSAAVLAADDPAAFLKRTKCELFEDWDADDTEELPWLALIEELDAAGRLAEVDWKEAGSEILAWLRRIGGPPARRALAALDEPGLDDRRTDEALALFGKTLGAAGLALLVLDKSSDSFPLMIVPAGDVAGLIALGRAAGGDIQHWTGKDLAKLEAERLRKLARDRTKNPWRMIIVAHEHMRGTDSEVENVLFQLRHDRDGELAARIRAALPFVPPRDRPLVELSLAMNDQPASKIAATTRDPALCLRALNNVRDHDDPRERLLAAATLAARLRLAPDRGKAHRQLGEALNLWASAPACDAALGKLSAAARDQLARLADGLLERGGQGLLSTAARALAHVGDATSLELLIALDQKARAKAAAYAAKRPSWSADPWSDDAPVPEAMRRIRARLGKRR